MRFPPQDKLRHGEVRNQVVRVGDTSARIVVGKALAENNGRRSKQSHDALVIDSEARLENHAKMGLGAVSPSKRLAAKPVSRVRSDSHELARLAA